MPPRTRRKPAAKTTTTSKRTTRRSAKSTPPPDFQGGNPYLTGNALVCGDNLDILRELPDDCIDLIYLDPPFNSNHNYVAAFGDKGRVDAQLRDIWRWTVESENQYQRLREGPLRNAINAVRLVSGETSPMAAYAMFMSRRLTELHRVLKPAGSIYLHCDPNADWLIRILLDTVFGQRNFRNEIIWCYDTAGRTRRYWNRKHDVIFFYSKRSEWTFNPLRVPRRNLTEDWESWYSLTDDDGRRYQIDGKGYKYYADEGRLANDWWDDIPALHAHRDAERIGYPTQKPLALLERIINASSNKGGFVLDPFCGCGTAADAAAKLERKYLGIDVSAIAVRVMEQRLASRGGKVKPVVHKMGWDDYEWEVFERRALMHESDAEDGLPGWAWAEDKVAGLLNAVPNGKKVGDGGVDARYFTERGEVIPIQVKMHQGQIGRPDMQKLLGVQTEWQNKKVKAPMSLMVTLYPPNEQLRVYARQQGNVTLRGERYPKMQVLSVQEMLTKQARPKLPAVDPRYFVGDTQTRLAIPA